MAIENKITASLSSSKSGNGFTASATVSYTLIGDHFLGDVQDIGTSDELIVFPADLLTEGITNVYFKNLDPTNYVTISIDVSGTKYPVMIIQPGMPAVFPPYSTSPSYYAKAHTAGIILSIGATGT